eukprot:gene16940-8429_t
MVDRSETVYLSYLSYLNDLARIKLQSKLRELEVNQEVQDQKLKGLEEQRGAFIEKSELMQNQLVSYQGQLARKKQLLEGLEQKHVAKIAELENEILRYNDEFNVQEETVKSLKRSLQESRLREENGWKEQMHLREEMEGTKAQLQKRENQISVLENDLQSIQLQQKKFESDAERIRSRQEDSILGKSKEHEERFKELERRYLSLQNEFKEKLQEKEERHTAELTGMKTQISSLTEDLHKRDVALAKMSERAGRMEEDLREMSSKHDKKEAELQDLRMFETQIAEIEGANARVVAQLEDENTYLKSEIASIRDEHDRLSAVNFELSEREKYNRETQISSPSREQPEDDTSERINTLQEQLNHTLRTYESDQDSVSNIGELRPISPKAATAMTDHSDNEEVDLTRVFELLGETTLSSERGSRRASLTRDFLSEEDIREKELQQILEARISDLEQRTNATLKKYQL